MERLAPYYHLLSDDWESAVVKQGEALATLLQEAGVNPGDPSARAMLLAAPAAGSTSISAFNRLSLVT